MNTSTPPPDDSWESDAVWKLLDNAAPAQPRPSFADDVVRMAKLGQPPRSWWTRWLSPVPLGGLAAGAAAVVMGIMALRQTPPSTAPDGPSLANVDAIAGQTDPYADLQDLAETEALLAAVDHLEDFSDQELGNLIGF